MKAPLSHSQLLCQPFSSLGPRSNHLLFQPLDLREYSQMLTIEYTAIQPFRMRMVMAILAELISADLQRILPENAT